MRRAGNSNRVYFSENVKYQRVLCSPLKKQGYFPEHNSEVFVKKIPPEETEYDLLRFFQTVGDVFQVRLMLTDDQKTNRGFAYISYFDVATANKAVATLNDVLYKGECYLSVHISLNNCRIFVGGIPTYKTKEQIWHELIVKGIQNLLDVIVYRSYSTKCENRGFVFLEFRSHEDASYFRAKYGKKLKLWGIPVIVDWSVPVPRVDESVMNAVKVIYLRNLNVCDTREDLRDLIFKFMPKETIEKVYKFKNYAFIHVVTRELAEDLMKSLKDFYMNTVVEITWSKPPNKFTSQEYRRNKVQSYVSSSLTLGHSYRRSDMRNIRYFSHCSRNVQFQDISSSDDSSFDTSSSIYTSPMVQSQNIGSASSSSLLSSEDISREISEMVNNVCSTPALNIQNAIAPLNELQRYVPPRNNFLDGLQPPRNNCLDNLHTPRNNFLDGLQPIHEGIMPLNNFCIHSKNKFLSGFPFLPEGISSWNNQFFPSHFNFVSGIRSVREGITPVNNMYNFPSNTFFNGLQPMWNNLFPYVE